MGCPPDPMEVSMWKSQDRIRELRDHALSLAEEAEALQQRFAAVFALATRHPLCSAMWKRNADRLARLQLDVPEVEAPSTPFTEDHMQTLWQQERAMHRAAKAQEKRLCTLRDFLVNVWRVPELAAQFSALGTDFDAVMEVQRTHRAEDKATWLEWLKVRHERYALLARQKSSPRHQHYALLLQKVEEEMRRMDALTEEQILMDCTLFGETPADFDPLADDE